VIADLSVNHVERHILGCGFSTERMVHDYGIDLLMFTYSHDGETENGHVEIQLKATDNPRFVNAEKEIAMRVDVADLNQWQWEPMPVVLVVYDARRDRAYWIDIQNYIETTRLTLDRSDRVTLRVPVKNRVNKRSILHFRRLRDDVLEQVKGVMGND
jgi:hypothetical protein